MSKFDKLGPVALIFTWATTNKDDPLRVVGESLLKLETPTPEMINKAIQAVSKDLRKAKYAPNFTRLWAIRRTLNSMK